MSLFVINTSIAQEDLSLVDAIKIGLENNFQIKIAEQNIDIAKRNNNWQSAGRTPTVDLSAQWNNSYNFQKNPASFFADLTTLSSGISPSANANWVFFDGYRTQNTKKQLEQLEAQSEQNKAVTIENSIRQIMLAYYQALIQKEQINVLEEVINLSRDRINEQTIRKEFGQAGAFDVLQSQDAYLNDSTTYLIQINTFENAIRNLNLAMGVDDFEKNYTLTDELIYEAPDYEFTSLEEMLFSKNRNLQNLLINRELANINSSLQESARYPRLSVGAGLAYNPSLTDGSGTLASGAPLEIDAAIAQNLNANINLTATYNLYNGGQTNRNIENAKVQEMIAQLSIEDQKRRLSGQLAVTLANYNNQKNLLQLTENLVENAKRNLEISEERFKAAQISSFDYRTIQLSYINASQARLNAYFNLKITEVDIMQLVGGL